MLPEPPKAMLSHNKPWLNTPHRQQWRGFLLLPQLVEPLINALQT
ncbi:hypothetical protein SynBMKMC1_01050 [Synechococcus sp. BMK-MC-1]|nr:hypothetical protein SynBMKMC1_01050 [Synechococcus sp. BMK-MC-1]